MFKKDSRRKASNIIVDPKALIRFSLPFLALIIFGVGMILVVHRQVLNTLGEVDSLTNYNPTTSVAIAAAIGRVTTTGMVGILVFGLVTLVLWIIYSHRIFGPTVPFRRHIGKLLEGDYTTRIQLRRTDEFKDIAGDLNKLAAKLQDSSK